MYPSNDEKRRLRPAATITYGIESLDLGLCNPNFLLTLADYILESTLH